ncbi:hypothetical protein ABT187_50050, partial [Streptomyces sp. NPDC001817]|uniref:hypothetical protein n=1 Tax=Streptomyces sp. NPDC001817 TaxID=3154398 RepID=UPI0033302A20
ARTYTPDGYFTTRDTYQLHNRHQAFGTNPIEHTDPTGHIPASVKRGATAAGYLGAAGMGAVALAGTVTGTLGTEESIGLTAGATGALGIGIGSHIASRAKASAAHSNRPDVREIFRELIQIDPGAEEVATRHLQMLSHAPLKDLQDLADGMRAHAGAFRTKVGIFIKVRSSEPDASSEWNRKKFSLVLMDDPDLNTPYRVPAAEAALHEMGHAMDTVRRWLSSHDDAVLAKVNALLSKVRNAYMDEWQKNTGKNLTLIDFEAINYLKDDSELLAEIYWFRHSPTKPALFAGSKRAADIIRNDISIFAPMGTS